MNLSGSQNLFGSHSVPYLAGIVAIPMILAGCSPQDSAPAPSHTTESTIQSSAPETDHGIHDVLTIAVAEITAQFGGSLDIAAYTADGPVSAGDNTARPAWSSSKVPLAIAALNRDPSLEPDAAAAITVSDNAAATRLRQSLGTPEQAAQAVSAVIAQSGVHVDVPVVPPRPEFSAFGQTAWTPVQQAQFAAYLPCIAGSETVRSMMGAVVPAQAYGLGRLAIEFKGGWGPTTPSGAYEVRQLGLLAGKNAADNGVIGLALTAEAADGSYETAQHMLDAAAEKLPPLLDSLPGTTCTKN